MSPNPPNPQKSLWADTPFTLIPTPGLAEHEKTGKNPEAMDQYTKAASGMALTHNNILRGLNSIYNQAPKVDPKDYKDFVGYALCFHGIISGHHLSEEEHLFPTIEEKTGEVGIMDVNVEQHQAFEAGLTKYGNYLSSLQGKEHEFNPQRLLSIIDEFGPLLHKHLTDEIPTLLGLSRYGSKLPLLDILTAEGRRAGSQPNKATVGMFFFINTDVTYEGGIWSNWPPIPWAVKFVLIRVLASWHPGYWKFASCDYNGKPKALYV